MFEKKKLNLEEMTAEEMRAFHSKIVTRMLWLNGLWLILVVFMLFWKTSIGILLLIGTVVKYFIDYHDGESQAVNAKFVSETNKKEVTERTRGN